MADTIKLNNLLLKVNPVGADSLPITDTEDSNNTKKIRIDDIAKGIDKSQLISIDANNRILLGSDLNLHVDVTDIESNVSINTSDIGINTFNIAINTADIATNTADIATNTAAIALNTEKGEETVLWTGSASSGTLTLNNDINNYRTIEFSAYFNNARITRLITVSSFIQTTTTDAEFINGSSALTTSNILFYYLSATEVEIKTSVSYVMTKIKGIK